MLSGYGWAVTSPTINKTLLKDQVNNKYNLCNFLYTCLIIFISCHRAFVLFTSSHQESSMNLVVSLSQVGAICKLSEWSS